MAQDKNSGGKLNYNSPLIMGILNITPDSFYGGSRVQEEDSILEKAANMVAQGADLLDIGGQSTRPTSTWLSAQEEADRVLPAIEIVAKHFKDTTISVDTFYSTVAQQAVKAGANLVNDVSGGSLDEAMIKTVGELGVPYVCMHMRGTPQTMQQQTQYDNIWQSLHDFFTEKITACTTAGINDVILDVGFGFAKTHDQNLSLLKKLPSFAIYNKPLLVGLSRKSTIYNLLHTSPEEALNGTSVLNTIALINGAQILRVHDVKEAKECVTLVQHYKDAAQW
jgi:dihydropteroate synthase